MVEADLEVIVSGDVSQRESLLESLQLDRRKGEDDRLRQQVEHWKELALSFLPEIYNLRRVIDSIDKRYFDGQGILFSSDSQRFDELLALVEKTFNIFNGSVAEDLKRLERLLAEAENGQDESSLTVDLAGLMEDVGEAATEQIAYLVDLAKADALEILGENRQALDLLDRYV